MAKIHRQSVGWIMCVLLLCAGCRAVYLPPSGQTDRLASGSSTESIGAQTGEGVDAPSGASPAQAGEAEGQIWPSRWGDDASRRGVIVELDPTTRLRALHYSRYHQGRSKPEDYADASALARALNIKTGFRFRVEGPGSFVFSEETLDKTSISNPPDMAFKFVSARRAQGADPGAGVVEGDGGQTDDYIELQRTWFTYRDPMPGKGLLGTVVLLPGMFGTPEPVVDATERYFRHEGYAVLRMLSHPSRFTEHTVLTYLDGRVDSVAKHAARIADDRIAECAYATDAALDHVFGKREQLKDKPVVLMGMSGGAMALPSVYAYRPDRYDAAVLIAGGANFLRIMIESNYRDWIDAILVDFDPLSDDLGDPDPELIETLSQRYLASSHLDAYHTATTMRGIPVLVLHASNDRAVPADTGDLLHERLGSPERWTYPLGHELIFAGLPMQIPRVERWLREHLGLPEDAEPVDATGEKE